MTEVKPGVRFYSTASSVDVIIVKPAAVQLACAGAPMVTAAPEERAAGEGANIELGKRYEDAESGLLVMCTKPGAGPLTADGRELQLLSAKPLPSSD